MYRYIEYDINTDRVFFDRNYSLDDIYSSPYFMKMIEENCNMMEGLESGCIIEGHTRISHIHFRMYKEIDFDYLI